MNPHILRTRFEKVLPIEREVVDKNIGQGEAKARNDDDDVPLTAYDI